MFLSLQILCLCCFYCFFFLFFLIFLFFFFFQAEDGIRDRDVTGVQTCALPISCARQWVCADGGDRRGHIYREGGRRAEAAAARGARARARQGRRPRRARPARRSEERRVGKECRSRGGAEQ